MEGKEIGEIKERVVGRRGREERWGRGVEAAEWVTGVRI